MKFIASNNYGHSTFCILRYGSFWRLSLSSSSTFDEITGDTWVVAKWGLPIIRYGHGSWICVVRRTDNQVESIFHGQLWVLWIKTRSVPKY